MIDSKGKQDVSIGADLWGHTYNTKCCDSAHVPQLTGCSHLQPRYCNRLDQNNRLCHKVYH